MNWFRLVALVIIAGLAVVGLTQTGAKAPGPQPSPTPLPTRLPLPTLAPQAIISRISREPRPTATAVPVSKDPRVEVVDYGYSPAQLTIHAGQTVTWVNQGADGHDVTGSDWRSGPLTPQESYSRVFVLPGTYAYECTMHPEMRGTVIVQ